MENVQGRKDVGIWIRVSTEDQARGESPEHHEKRARYYAESKGWNIKEVYHLEAVSGKAVIEHPEAQKMLNHIKTGHISGLIFSKLARLARNTRELLEFADIFNQYGADLISLQESIDTSTPAGMLFYTIIAAMSQWERAEIASRVAASVGIRAKLGKPLGGQAPFGYQWKDRQLIPNPKEVPVAKLIYEYFIEHQRKKTVARILNEKGYRTRIGARFSDTTIDRLLNDPTAKGLHRLNYTKSLGSKKNWVYKPKEEWVALKVEPIVPADLWDKCHAILADQEKNRKPVKKALHLFTGFVFCECGGRMTVPSESNKYICHKCRNKIPMKDLEEIYQQQLKNFLFSPDEISDYLDRCDKVIKEKLALLQSMEDEKQKVEKEKAKVYKAYVDDEITVKTYGTQFRPLEERLEQINDRIPELQGEIDFLKIKYLSSEEVINEAKDLYSKWNDLTFEEKRRIIENITEKITIGKEDISIKLLSVLPPKTPSSNNPTVPPASSSPASPNSPQNGNATSFMRCQSAEIVLTAKKPVNPAFPKTVNTIGDHIRKHRLNLKMTQKQVSATIGATESSITGWENNWFKPHISFMPKIIEFLGYIPQPYNKLTTNIIEKIKQYRQIHGLTQEKFAELVGVDETTVAKWERGEHEPSKYMLSKLTNVINPI
ncbi:MAG: recombinase family protein [Candidatus Pacebacteria bacterium]|nr:recombinase family protein [Candidatus Paceibacterota bacterium]